MQSLQWGFWRQALCGAAAAAVCLPCAPWCCVGARYQAALRAWVDGLNERVLARRGLLARFQTASWDSVEAWFGRVGYQRERADGGAGGASSCSSSCVPPLIQTRSVRG